MKYSKEGRYSCFGKLGPGTFCTVQLGPGTFLTW